MVRMLEHLLVALGFSFFGVFLGNACGMAQKHAATGARALVSLVCRVPAVSRGPHESPHFLVELRTGSDELIRRAECLAGDSARFRNLDPGVYRVCLAANGRKSCQSVDATPGPTEESAEFMKELRMPESSEADPALHRVSVRSLAVPKSALEQLELSEKDKSVGNDQEMARHLQQAIEDYPDYSEAWNNLGAYWHRKRNFQEAIRCFSRVTEIDPTFNVGWRNLGSSLLASMKFADSLEANRKAVRLEPGDVVGIFQLALSYYYLRKYEDAKKYFREVMDLDPAYANSPQVFLAHIAMGEGDFENAVTYFRSFLEYHPNSPEVPRIKNTLKAITDGSIKYESAKKRK